MSKANNIRYFLTINKDGKELPHIMWSGKLNAVVAQAHPENIFIVSTPEAIDMLVAQGNKEVDEDFLTSLKIDNPVPDRIDYTIREGPRYFKS